MFYYNALNLEQIGGGNQIKQGDFGSRFSYKLENEKNKELDNFDTKVAHINLVLDDKIVFTTTTTVDKSTVTFNIDKAIPVGLYFLEIKIDDYIFPSDRQTIIFVQSGSVAYDLKDLVPNYDTNMTLSSILSDLSQKGIDISDLKTKMNAIYNNALSDHTEITQARGGLTSLDARLDGLDVKDSDLQRQINTNKTSIVTEGSRIDNLIANAGNTDGNAELLDIRVDADGIKHDTGANSTRFSQKGRLIDFDETSFAYGYKKFLPLPWEYQAINTSTGVDMVDTQSVRTPNNSKISFSGDVIIKNDNTSLYRWRWIIYNADGTYKNFITWKTNAKNTMSPDSNLLYRFQIATTDGSDINIDDALKSIKLFYVNDYIGYTYDNIYDATDYIFAIGGGLEPAFSKNGNSIKVTMPGTSLFFRDNSGKQISKSPSQYNSQIFTVGSDQVLVWNLDDNTIVVQGVAATRNKRNVVLLYNLYGSVQDGVLKSYYDNQVLNNRLNNPVIEPNVGFISRQGEIGGYPENTLHGIKYACENGYKNVRVSVNLTADGVPVLFHDDTINRLARNADGSTIEETLSIRNLTLEQVNSYDWGAISGKPELTGLDITTLNDFVKYAKYRGIDIRLELKGTYNADNVDTILGILIKYGMVSYTTFSSDVKAVLDLFYSKCPVANYAFIGHFGTAVINNALLYKNQNNKVFADIYDEDLTLLNTTDLLYAKNNNVMLKVGSVGTLVDLYAWVDTGIDFVEVAYITLPAYKVVINQG